MVNLYHKGDCDLRPWGSWAVLDCAEDYCVKRITINPHGMISLQLHHYRKELWVIVEGSGIVTLDSESFTVQKRDIIEITPNTKHRIANKSDTPIVLIEIQTGDKLDEDDIVRFEDIYGRI